MNATTAGTTADTEVRDYLAAVSRALTDLPASERDDLLDDLDDHLHEVLAEGDGSLEQRLGPPEQYAAELRVSAGLAPSDGSTASLLHRAIDAMSTNALWRRTAEHPWTRATLDFLPQLRPAWWIARAFLAVEFIAQFNRWLSGRGSVSLNVVPRVASSKLLGVVLVAVAIPISIQLGRRALRGGTRWLVIAGNVLAAFMVVPTLASLGSTTYYVPAAQTATPSGVFNNGRQITNIYPYDAQGLPLEHVRLYDDAGQPLTTATDNNFDAASGQYPAASAPASPGAPPANDYPTLTTVIGPDGAATAIAIPRPGIAVLPLPSPPANASATASSSEPASPTVTPTPTPSPAPSVSPAPSPTASPTH
jgi:hypothetical protein